MALDDREHVEAVAIMRKLKELLEDARGQYPYYTRLHHHDASTVLLAADVWLRENHPEPSVYTAAIRSTFAERNVS